MRLSKFQNRYFFWMAPFQWHDATLGWPKNSNRKATFDSTDVQTLGSPGLTNALHYWVCGGGFDASNIPKNVSSPQWHSKLPSGQCQKNIWISHTWDAKCLFSRFFGLFDIHIPCPLPSFGASFLASPPRPTPTPAWWLFVSVHGKVKWVRANRTNWRSVLGVYMRKRPDNVLTCFGQIRPIRRKQIPEFKMERNGHLIWLVSHFGPLKLNMSVMNFLSTGSISGGRSQGMAESHWTSGEATATGTTECVWFKIRCWGWNPKRRVKTGHKNVWTARKNKARSHCP